MSSWRQHGRAVALGNAVLSVGAVLAAVLLPMLVDSPAEPANGAAGAGRADDAQAAPTATFRRFDGSAASVADYRGTPLVLNFLTASDLATADLTPANFWASWCPPCVAEMRDVFEPAHQRYAGRVALLGVAMQDTREAADRTVAATG